MTDDIRVEYDDFRAFSFAVRRANRDLSNAMKRELRAEVNQFRDAIRRAWTPVEGGLATKWKESKPIKGGKTNITSSVSSTRARVTAAKSQSMRYLNQGFVRHPGVIRTGAGTGVSDRSRWYSTAEGYATGWWDRTVTREAPKVARGVQEVLDDYADQVAALTRASGGSP